MPANSIAPTHIEITTLTEQEKFDLIKDLIPEKERKKLNKTTSTGKLGEKEKREKKSDKIDKKQSKEKSVTRPPSSTSSPVKPHVTHALYKFTFSLLYSKRGPPLQHDYVGYFVGDMSREIAESFLQGAGYDSFLIRNSSRPGDSHTLSLIPLTHCHSHTATHTS